MNEVEIGEMIKNARLAKGWTQGKLADEAAVSRYCLLKMEKGTSNSSLFVYDCVLKVLGLKFMVVEANEDGK